MTATADHSQSPTGHRIAFVRLPRACDVTNDRVVLDQLAAALTGAGATDDAGAEPEPAEETGAA